MITRISAPEPRASGCRSLTVAVQLLWLILASVASLYSQAQSNSADLKGVVQDPSGAAIAGATLSVKDPQTGLNRSAMSDRNGEFLFTSLPPSKYSLRVESPGFAVRKLGAHRLWR